MTPEEIKELEKYRDEEGAKVETDVAQLEADMNAAAICSTCSVPMEDEYFGVCPTCHKNDGSINVGRSHWFFCKEHRVKWCVGDNLFSSWKDETKEQQHEKFESIGMGSFTEVESHMATKYVHTKENTTDDSRAGF